MITKSKTTKPDFKGQDFFIGIDVHLKNWKVSIRHNFMELKTFSMNPSPEALLSYMQRNYPNGSYHSVYEAGFCGFWIHRRLSDLGIDNIVVNPADVPTMQKERDQKRDAVDSRKLARNLESASLKGIYIPSEEQQAFRSVARVYQQKVRQRKIIKQQIKSFLHLHGVPIVENHEMVHWSGNFIDYLQKLRFPQEETTYCLQYLLSNLLQIRADRLKLLRYMREISKDVKIIRLLRSIPGIGFITAFLLYAELMDIHRFKNADAVAKFIGIVPSVHSTNKKEKVKGITLRHNKYLRKLLIESAWVAIRQDPALTAAFTNYSKRMVKQKAIIRIARKLVNRIRYVWVNEREYQIGVVV